MDASVIHALSHLTTGIYVLTVNHEGHHHGMSSSWVTQVSGDPPLFTAAVDNEHFSRGLVMKTRAFGLNIVGRRGHALEDYFYSAKARRSDNLSDVAYRLSPQLEVPWLELAMIAIEARVRDTLVAGDHTILVAEVAGVRIGQADRPLTSLELDYVYVGGKQVLKRDRSGWD
ncbi:MAG TPA: flavin reductase family protein [Candidatus Binataceae bacterium]|jgi:flavin reductase (DIM6/NTAB) family NADH-FMN oxidoreductase RutF|nr:flavin reductase family protein [Candidatus Binataceae bacterium]